MANVFRCVVLASMALLIARGASAQEIGALAFLTGHWRETTDQSLTEETWLGPRGDMMASVNLSTRNGRTSFEMLRIVKRDGKLVLLASPEGRHPPTEFPLQAMRDGEVVFENPEIQFPRRIIYRRDGDALHARIEGTVNGQARGREWTFRRVVQ